MIAKQTYKDAVSFKLHNRRVTVIKKDEVWDIEFRLATNVLEPRSLHKVVKNKVVVTTIKLHDDIARAMVQAFLDQMKPLEVTK